MNRLTRVTYAMAPNLRVAIGADRSDVAGHFAAEYGVATSTNVANAELQIDFQPVQTPAITGGYKTIRWRVGLQAPDDGPLVASIDLQGRPRSFGLSLVQGFFVEPLLSLAAARAGRVLLPCAAIQTEQDGLTLILGRSRSGKSSLAVRALPGGAVVFGDDQAFLDAGGNCSRFPRRMRFYSDVRQTAPRAFSQLRPPVRTGLVALGAVRRLSRGFIAPPVRVPIEDLGQAGGLSPVPVRRIVVLERFDGISSVQHDEISADETAQFALELLDDQREKLARAGAAWAELITTLRSAESEMLRSAFRTHAVERLRVPMAWGATDALPVLGHLLRLPS